MSRTLISFCVRSQKRATSNRGASDRKEFVSGRIQPIVSLLLLYLFISIPAVATAQSLPTGLQEYYVLGRDSQVFDFCNYIGSGEGFTLPNNAAVSIVTVTGTMDGQTIIYDHWEDGYEIDPFHPIQTTTETHTLNHGQVITFASDGSGTGVNAVIPIPRVNTDLRYDGGDRIISLGGPVNLAHAMWPDTVWLIADAWEVYPRQALTGFYTYRVPVGENSYTNHGGDTGTFAPFKYVVLQVSAYEDNTSVVINNGPDQVSFTLNRGQTYSTLGWIDETAASPIGVRENSLVSADKDIQVGILSGSDGQYQTRFYNMVPLKAYGRDYIVPVRGSTGYPVNIYLFNPNAVATSVTLYPGGNTYSIPANSSRSWIDLTGSALPNGSGGRILSTELIWGVVAYDYTATSRDWGFSLIPTRYLRNEYYVSWSPVDNTPTPGPWRQGGNPLGGNPVWITPLQDNTTVQIYLNGDTTPDSVDTNGDGIADSGTSTTLNVLQVMRVYDQTDGRNDGTRIVASGPVAVSYGQDDICSTGGDSLDLGYAVLPLTQDFLSPIATVTATPSTTTVPTGGGDVIVTLKIQAGNYDDITGVNGWLNTNSANVSYVSNSAAVTAPGFSGNLEPTIVGNLLTWNLNYTLDHNQEITIQLTLRWAGSAPNQAYSLQGGADATYLIQTFHPYDNFQIVKTYLELAKQVDLSSASAGDTLTYTITAHNSSGTSTVTNLVVTDSLNEGLGFLSADHSGTFSQQTRTVTWSLGNLTPGASVVLTLQALVQVLPEVTDIGNQAIANATGLPTVYSNIVNTMVTFPLLNITKSASTNSVTIDDEITFQLLIENQSLANATNVVIRDQIPVNTTYVTGSLTVNGTPQTDVLDTDAGDFNVTTSGGISARFASFPASGSATVTFRVTVDSDAPAGFHIANLATSESDTTLVRSSNIVSINVFRACTAGSQCPTTFCVDGVCCDTACGGGSTTDCLACSVAAGAAANGTCSPLTGNSCNDSNLCTQTDTCQAGTCTGTNPVVCPQPDQCHNVGACNTTTGLCSNPNKPDDTPCDGGLGECISGLCQCLDRDHDGICDAFDICPDDPTNTCNTCLDTDNDGICDVVDPCPTDPTNTCQACTDTDQDGICDSVDPCPTDPTNMCSACGDTSDPDNDGKPNCVDPCPNDPFDSCIPCNDRDHDGICDAFDICPDDPLNLCQGCTDSDGDGICDVVDPCPTDPTNTCQACTDTDHDGLCDSVDPCPTDPTNTCVACRDTSDPDNDGEPNCVDPCPNDPFDSCIPCNDRDHDGICDAFDICPDDPTNTCHNCPDADNDGICDVVDPCPNDPTNTCQPCIDTDNDELCDNVDPCPTDPTNTCSACRDTADPDGDGLPNCVDPCPNDPTNTCFPCPDRDHDGICDSRDLCPDDPQNKCASCSDRDNDGICDALDPCPDNPDPNCTCTDTDGDGICDQADPCPNDPTNMCSACRDTADPDNDGLPNCVDPCPHDSTNTCMNLLVAGGGCGCGTTRMDFGGLLPLLLGLLFLKRFRHRGEQSTANHLPR